MSAHRKAVSDRSAKRPAGKERRRRVSEPAFPGARSALFPIVGIGASAGEEEDGTQMILLSIEGATGKDGT